MFVPQVGPNALSRVQRDVLSQTGVKTCIYPGCERPAVPAHPQ